MEGKRWIKRWCRFNARSSLRMDPFAATGLDNGRGRHQRIGVHLLRQRSRAHPLLDDTTRGAGPGLDRMSLISWPIGRLTDSVAKVSIDVPIGHQINCFISADISTRSEWFSGHGRSPSAACRGPAVGRSTDRRRSLIVGLGRLLPRCVPCRRGHRVESRMDANLDFLALVVSRLWAGVGQPGHDHRPARSAESGLIQQPISVAGRTSYRSARI